MICLKIFDTIVRVCVFYNININMMMNMLVACDPACVSLLTWFHMISDSQQFVSESQECTKGAMETCRIIFWGAEVVWRLMWNLQLSLAWLQPSVKVHGNIKARDLSQVCVFEQVMVE